MTRVPRAAIIGGGPAGLMAAETVLGRGIQVDLYDAMPSLGRKFLMAGKSGLNFTKREDKSAFLDRYDSEQITGLVDGFDADAVMDWVVGLGIPLHTGPTGRVFPKMMKASPLLRAWLARLSDAGLQVHTKHRWSGWSKDGGLVFDDPEGRITATPDVTIFALGGGSWKRLGSNGAWTKPFETAGVALSQFRPSNCGFICDWSDYLREKFSGTPVKAVRLSAPSGKTTGGEFVITKTGIESGGVYGLSAELRDAIDAQGQTTLTLDLAPDVAIDTLRAKLARPRGKQSLSSHLRKAANLSPIKRALVFEIADAPARAEPARLAALIKSLPLTLTATSPIDDAISTAGGVAWDALTHSLMLKSMPGHFCAGEMLDWDAPTGGYLITACLASGHAAGMGAADWLASTHTP